ncbi:MAG: N-6 DNA methylase [Phycisphaerae bacterium]|nr:N-6 DNA methylase [Phycisphaerae bacterium]
MSAKPEYLFRKMDPARYGDNRQKRPLFVQGYLKEKSQDHRLQDDRCERAHEIIVKWADLESSGALQTQTESNLEGEFPTQVFGEALGYTLFSEGLSQWNLKPKFRVNDQTADAAIGFFEAHREIAPRAVIELKGPTVNVDRDKFDGRTPVRRCWDYLAEVPDCPWGIVSNIVSFRLYHRAHTTRVYQLFTLQDLRRWEAFLQFYCLFERGGLLPVGIDQVARADALLERSEKRQREVGDELYRDYHDNRVRLIQYLTGPAHAKPLDVAIRVAQKLVDRIIFIAFCEDRELLPARSLFRAWKEIPPFYRVTNPKWQNFLALFRSVDEGSSSGDVPAYNGGLFRKDDDVDGLQFDDRWTDFFKNIGEYDFGSEVNVDILGHLFEKSINDIERIRVAGGLWESKGDEAISSKMEKSAERKRGGIYYTPPEFTRFIVEHTVEKVATEKLGAVEENHGIDLKSPERHTQDGKLHRCVEEAVAALRTIRVVDPACGSGAFLIQAYDVLEEHYFDLAQALDHVDPTGAEAIREQMPDFILHDNLFGVDLSPEAVEITQLSLWLRSAHRGKTLTDLSKNIVCGNSLVTDPEVDPRAMSWETTFPRVFVRDEVGFDCVIGNPPWERFSLKNREFFAVCAPDVLETSTAAESRSLIAKLETENPVLYRRYVEARDSAERTMTYIRRCERFPLTGKGDINTYAVFAELAKSIVAPNGRAGLLVPSGIATDNTTKDFFGQLIDNDSLIGLYDFENKAPIFPDVHRSSKFCVLLFGGSERKSEKADFVFFAHRMEDLEEDNRHISLTKDDFKRLNPNTLTCPVFRSKRDAEITKAVYRCVPILLNFA